MVASWSIVSRRWVAPGLPDTKTASPSVGLSAFQTKWVGVSTGFPSSYRRMKAASMAKRGKEKLSRSPPKVAARSSGAQARRTSVYLRNLYSLNWPPRYRLTTWQRILGSFPQASVSIRPASASRAWVKAWPSSPAPALCIRSVTSEMSVRISAVAPGHLRSSSRVLGVKPVSPYCCCGVDRLATQVATQWLLVITSPWPDTTPAEQPPNFTDDSRTRSRKAWSILVPSVWLARAMGKLS